MNWAGSKSTGETLPDGLRFESFFMGGFECSTHRLRSGVRLDMIAATRHDEFALPDYERMKNAGLRVAREGVRWHLVEQTPGHYDFSSVLPIVRAARQTGTRVIWDLCHFGWPDHLDLFTPEFASALGQYGAAFARWLRNETDESGWFVPVNEISFFSWAAGEEGTFNPFQVGRGLELKKNLVRAAIEAMDRIRAADPGAKFIHVDPIIHVIAHPDHPEERADAEAYRCSQFQAWDMLLGRAFPELGGNQSYVDMVGVNFYPNNQWFYNFRNGRPIRKFRKISRRHPLHRPLREILLEVHERYRRPIVIAETGAEDRIRAGWLRYVCAEADAALRLGVPLHGICLYPIVNHPGWDDERHCRNALWDYPDENGNREVYAPLARELRRQQKYFERARLLAREALTEPETVGA